MFFCYKYHIYDEDYKICNKTNNDIDWRILEDSIQDNMDPIPTIPISNTLMPHCGGSVVKRLNWFIYLGESVKAILEEHEIPPIDYDKAMNDVDAHLW